RTAYLSAMPQTPKSSRAWPVRRVPIFFALLAALVALFAYGTRTSIFAGARSQRVRKTSLEQRDSTQTVLPRVAARFYQRHELTVIAFGSSSTQGVGASSPAHAYPALLEKDLRTMLGAGATIRIINRGVGGEDADDMLARLSKDVLSQKPDLVI